MSSEVRAIWCHQTRSGQKSTVLAPSCSLVLFLPDTRTDIPSCWESTYRLLCSGRRQFPVHSTTSGRWQWRSLLNLLYVLNIGTYRNKSQANKLCTLWKTFPFLFIYRLDGIRPLFLYLSLDSHTSAFPSPFGTPKPIFPSPAKSCPSAPRIPPAYRCPEHAPEVL